MKKRSSCDDSIPPAPEHAGGPIMLACSTFRRSEHAARVALEKATECGEIVLVNVVDVNVRRYLIGSDIGLYPDLGKRAEEELLEVHARQGRVAMNAIAERAKAKGLRATVHVRTGRFALVCLEIIKEVKPSLVVTTRSRRPAWLRKLFGSPVDYLMAHASCPVIIAESRKIASAGRDDDEA